MRYLQTKLEIRTSFYCVILMTFSFTHQMSFLFQSPYALHKLKWVQYIFRAYPKHFPISNCHQTLQLHSALIVLG